MLALEPGAAADAVLGRRGRLALHLPGAAGVLRQPGAYVCGEPAWDPDFNTADLPILLPLKNLNPIYARHFLKPA